MGGPDTGKTNFVGRLWLALQVGGSALISPELPDRIVYLEQVVAHLNQGSFAPRTDQNADPSDNTVILPLASSGSRGSERFDLVVPDVSGEIWQRAAERNELAPQWMAQLEHADAAMIFVRVRSELNINPVDWVTAGRLMGFQRDDTEVVRMPTQVMLCEYLRFLEATLRARPSGQKPRVGIAVTAWDLLDDERSECGPMAYLDMEYPLFAGRLADVRDFDVKAFGVSILGGDVKDDAAFRDQLLSTGLQSAGYVVSENQGKVRKSSDMTLPVAWAIGA